MDGQELAGIRLFGATIPIQSFTSTTTTTTLHDHHASKHKQDDDQSSTNIVTDLEEELDDIDIQLDLDQDETESTETINRGPEKAIECPRCKSMETKFCYFNNYNVNQPRHFCKGCQRYWTAGGALRNVPVGAGRRKNINNTNNNNNKPPSNSLVDNINNCSGPQDWQLTAPGLPQVKRRRSTTSAGQSC